MEGENCESRRKRHVEVDGTAGNRDGDSLELIPWAGWRSAYFQHIVRLPLGRACVWNRLRSGDSYSGRAWGCLVARDLCWPHHVA